MDQQPPSRTPSQQRHLHQLQQQQEQKQHHHPKQPAATAVQGDKEKTPSSIFSPVADQDDDVGGTLVQGKKSNTTSISHRHPHHYYHQQVHASSSLATFPADASVEGLNHLLENNSRVQEETVYGLEVLEVLPIPTLRSSLARSSTIISTTSASGRPRLTHRLSYLTHLDDLEAEEKEEESKTGGSPLQVEQTSIPPIASTAPAPPPPVTPTTRVLLTREQGTASVLQPPPVPSKQPSPRLAEQQQPPLSYPWRSKAVIPPSVPSSSQPTVPPIPKLYRRLLRVFKPPSDSSDSTPGGGGVVATSGHRQTRVPTKHHPPQHHHQHHHHHHHNHHGTSAPVATIQPRSPFGLPTSRENSSRGSLKSLPSKKIPIEKPVVIMPAPLVMQKPPESKGGGFRARLLRKLMSSPNLNTVAYPAVTTTLVVAPPVPLTTRADAIQKANSTRNNKEEAAKKEPPPPSPLLSDFEHDETCPAGQRFLDRCNRDTRPRASTVPRVPPPVPTLQSKYGVPGRELGAGTQAQVMMLRVKSSKRSRNTYPASSFRNKNIVAPTQTASPTASPLTSGTIVIQDRPSSRSGTFVDDPVPSSSSFAARARTGTLMTTTEENVTPEQREAYRKKLLVRRTSTGGASVSPSGGGLIYAIKKFRPPKATETHRQYLKKVCAEFCISTSMDHENIIRTIDLVRDQPGQEHLDEEEAEEYHGPPPRSYSRSSKSTFSNGQLSSTRSGSGPKRGEEGWQDNEEKDCNCSREHRLAHNRRIRTLKNNGDATTESRSNSTGATLSGHGGSSGSSTSSKQHRPIRRKSVISKPQRKRSVDTTSLRGSEGASTPVGHPTSTRILQGQGHYQSHYNQHHLHNTGYPAPPPNSMSPAAIPETSAQAMAAAKKKKQQLEQELRLREVQKLKTQRMREKERAKQQRLDLFPEYCMVMEFAAGGDLFNLLTKAQPPITLNEKHCLWRQLVNGVKYMHSMGVAVSLFWARSRAHEF